MTVTATTTLTAVTQAIVEAAQARVTELDFISQSQARYVGAAALTAVALDMPEPFTISAKSIGEANAETLAAHPEFAETGLMFTSAGTVILFGHLGRLMSLPGELPEGVTARMVMGWLQTAGLSVTRIKSIISTEVTVADAAREVKKAAGAAKAKKAADKKAAAAKAALSEASAAIVTGATDAPTAPDAPSVPTAPTATDAPTDAPTAPNDTSAKFMSAAELLMEALELIREATSLDWSAEEFVLADGVVAEINAKIDLLDEIESAELVEVAETIAA